MIKQLIYPNPDFIPETRTLHDGTLVAHYLDTPVWCSLAGAMYVLEGTTFKRKAVSGLAPQKNYARKTRNGCVIGQCYPHFNYRGVNYYAHKVMALAWIGPRPQGWQIDHLNGDIRNWTITNIRIVTKAENYRCARYLRVMRECGFDPRIFSSKDFLYWFAMPFDEFKTFFNHYKND